MVEPESECFSFAMKFCTVAGTKENVVILTLMFFLINMTIFGELAIIHKRNEPNLTRDQSGK
jgi:hypothetical protein